MDNKSSLPAPAGLSALDRAKMRDMPLGGAPPISMGGVNLAQQQERARQDAVDAQMRASKAAENAAAAAQNTSGLPKPVVNPGARSPEEVRRDVETIAEVARVASSEETAPEEKVEEKSEPAEDPKNMLAELDDFEWDRLEREMEHSDFNNPILKKKIEARCKPMKVGDLVSNAEACQNVPIKPGELEVEFQTVKGRTDLKIKQMLFQEEGSDRYIFDKYSIMNLTAGIRSINRYPLPDYRDENGNFDEKKFEEKLECVLNYPIQMIGILSVNFIWFDQRVRRLFTTDELGNG